MRLFTLSGLSGKNGENQNNLQMNSGQTPKGILKETGNYASLNSGQSFFKDRANKAMVFYHQTASFQADRRCSFYQVMAFSDLRASDGRLIRTTVCIHTMDRFPAHRYFYQNQLQVIALGENGFLGEAMCTLEEVLDSLTETETQSLNLFISLSKASSLTNEVSVKVGFGIKGEVDLNISKTLPFEGFAEALISYLREEVLSLQTVTS